MTKIIVPLYAYTLTGMLILGGVSAQTTREGDLRECTGRGWNTCNNSNWTHCMWVGTRDEGKCHNNCPVIGFPNNIGTPRDCHNLEGCDLVGFSTRCDFTDRDLQCSTANDDDWVTTQRNCQALEGCTFSLIPGQNECIPVVDCSSANDRDWHTTWSQCHALDGCKFNTAWGENECIKDCSSANDANWLTTLAQCQVIKGCMFNPAVGKNECIEESSMATEAYVGVENDLPKPPMPDPWDPRPHAYGDVEPNIHAQPWDPRPIHSDAYVSAETEPRDGDMWGCKMRTWHGCSQHPSYCRWEGTYNDGICMPRNDLPNPEPPMPPRPSLRGA